MAGRRCPEPPRCLAPRQSGSSPGCCRIVRDVSEGSRRPSAVSGMPPSLRNQRHGVPCLARCISPPAAIRSRRGTSVAVSRARTPGLPLGASGFPDYGFPRSWPQRCGPRRIAPTRPGHALDFRVAPAMLSHETRDSSQARRTIQASSALHYSCFANSPCGHRVRIAYGAPSLPDCSPHAANTSIRRRDVLRQRRVVTGRGDSAMRRATALGHPRRTDRYVSGRRLLPPTGRCAAPGGNRFAIACISVV